MALTGKAMLVTVKSEENPKDSERYQNAILELTASQSNPRLFVKLPSSREILYDCELNDCEYIEQSSQADTEMSVRNRSTKEVLTIMDKGHQAEDLLREVRRHLQSKGRKKSPSAGDNRRPAVSQEKLNRFLEAWNSQKQDEAVRALRELAEEKAPIGLGLDLKNESGDLTKTQPTAKIFKLKLTIESFLTDRNDHERYDVVIYEKTTIKDLKKLVSDSVGIPSNHQYWYIRQELLDDNYSFGHSKPAVNEETELILYITKPLEN